MVSITSGILLQYMYINIFMAFYSKLSYTVIVSTALMNIYDKGDVKCLFPFLVRDNCTWRPLCLGYT